MSSTLRPMKAFNPNQICSPLVVSIIPVARLLSHLQITPSAVNFSGSFSMVNYDTTKSSVGMSHTAFGDKVHIELNRLDIKCSLWKTTSEGA